MAACVACGIVLVLEVDQSDDESAPATSSKAPAQKSLVPDDVDLSCGCHFHWQCLFDAYQDRTCPNCGRDISSLSGAGTPQILCNLNNEGGLQKNLDILPLLTEEAYLRAHPEDRICRAFLELCREGDVAALVDLLGSCEEVDEDEEDGPPFQKKSADEVLRFQDPIGDMQSGLHAAVSGQSREVAWLLLLLASEYPELEFPALVFQEASSLGVMRGDQSGKADVRSLRDAQGRTAEQLAEEVGGVWHGWAGTGRLAT